MPQIKRVKINGEEIRLLNNVLYLHYSEGDGYSLLLDTVITEVDARKYSHKDKAEVLLRYDDDKEESLDMFITGVTEVGNGDVPVLELEVNIDNHEKFRNLEVVNGDSIECKFPDPTVGITIEEVRKIDMPSDKIDITAILPIDLKEWLHSNNNISEILKEALYDYINKKASE
ncbi:hypothetical protein [Bacillus cihuensis]|uniref:hypothetical protein n=1 Tax=Bacillus cihuensis TaxID=1208599 RepID=UPI000424F9BB|nr:hypothetical protein [Bacillus cihuensis]